MILIYVLKRIDLNLKNIVIKIYKKGSSKIHNETEKIEWFLNVLKSTLLGKKGPNGGFF